jgi:hypothetical protein
VSKPRFFVIIANNRGDALIPVVDAPDNPDCLYNFPTREAAIEYASNNALARAAGARVFEYDDGEFV